MKSKESVKFVQVIPITKPKDYGGYEMECLGIDSLGRVWRYTKRVSGDTNWSLTEFTFERKYQWDSNDKTI